MWPGRWDVSVGGHLDAEESVAAARDRELREELGVVEVDEARFVDLGCRRTESREGESISRETQAVFLLVDQRPLEAYSIDPDETQALALVELG